MQGGVLITPTITAETCAKILNLYKCATIHLCILDS